MAERGPYPLGYGPFAVWMNKAAGGIHAYEENRAFIEVGASALGASAGIVIVEGAPTDESR